MNTEEQATGCVGAGFYRQYANQLGFKHIEALDRSSSAGDWSFLVSRDGNLWHLMTQHNNYPRAGFTHMINEKSGVIGPIERVLNYLHHEPYALQLDVIIVAPLMTNKEYLHHGGDICPNCKESDGVGVVGRAELNRDFGTRQAECQLCGATWVDHWLLSGYSDLEIPE